MGCIAPRGALDRRLCGDPCVAGQPFCQGHAQATMHQRGGWISADRRRRRMAPAVTTLDVSNIAPRLWIGSAPTHGMDMPDFDVLVLCAEEFQPDRTQFHGVTIRCPIPDAVLDNSQLARALIAAKATAEGLAVGRRVLVTCMAGLNRSAFVAALALGRLTRKGADEVISIVRTRRHPQALSNQYFVTILRHILSNGRRPLRG